MNEYYSLGSDGTVGMGILLIHISLAWGTRCHESRMPIPYVSLVTHSLLLVLSPPQRSVT